MTKAAPDILAQIVERKRAAVRDNLEILERLAENSIPARRAFSAALVESPPAIIAEIKKASPSRGVLAADFDPGALARAYERGGAAALSVLTDEAHFQGSLAHLEAARAAASRPALRKDFTIQAYDVVEAAAHGADAILLIAAILEDAQMRDFRELAERYGMAALVEVHDEEELRRALGSGARIVGVNNRNLRTFEIDLGVCLRLAQLIPGAIVRVAESGIRSAEDVRRLRAAGYTAFLVGEHLMTSGDPAEAVRALRA